MYNTLHFKEYITGENEIHVFISPVNGHYREHAHDFIEIAYIDSGEGIQTINNADVQVKEGDLFLLNAYSVIHSFDSQPGKPLYVYNCLFQPCAVNSSFVECNDFVDVAYNYLLHATNQDCSAPKNYVKISGLKSKEIESIIYEMHKEYEKKEEGYLQILKSNLIKLLILIFRNYKKDQKQTQNNELYQNLMVQNAINTMKTHYKEDIKCEQLAHAVYLSVNYFRKVFKEVTGLTMIEMLQKIRVDVACELLTNTNMGVIEIANNVGYSDIKFFYKIFAKQKAMTPGEYRSQFSQKR